MKNQSKHCWKFFKAGGAYQARINTVEDIKNIGKLDRKLWSALACPASGLSFDKKLLEILDTKKDGKIRCDEIVTATQWLCANIKDASVLLDSPSAINLSNINDTTDEGKALLASAKTILANLGKPNIDEISVADFSDTQKIFINSSFNADGIVAENAFDTPKLKALFADILSASEVKIDRSGLNGINKNDIDKFFEGAKAFVDWQNLRNTDPTILPLGEATDDAFATFTCVKEKIDDFFTRVEILKFDPDASASVNAPSDTIAKILSGDVSTASDLLKTIPIARISKCEVLDLLESTNPAWNNALKNFANQVAMPIVNSTKISKEDWEKIKSLFAPFAAWLAKNPNTTVSKIARDRLDVILAENKIDDMYKAIESDEAVKTEVENIEKVEKLVRLASGILKLLRNFVNFQEFYKDKGEAIFQFGDLYIDSRMCSLCVKVEDVAKHSAMSALSYGYLLYCVCKRKGEADMNIAAMVTAGDCDNFIIGRNGLFYDRQGKVWDATITKIVDNPIGISQAFFSPYKRFIKWASEQIAKRAGAADAKANEALKKGIPIDAQTKKVDLGTVAALGVAVGGITTALGLVINAFLGLGYWLPLGIIGLLLAISLPSMIVAALKLRMRNIAPLLDANGWAINSKACVGMAFGSHLTQTARRM